MNQMSKENKKWFENYFNDEEKRYRLRWGNEIIIASGSRSFCYAMQNKLKHDSKYSGFSNLFKIEEI